MEPAVPPFMAVGYITCPKALGYLMGTLALHLSARESGFRHHYTSYFHAYNACDRAIRFLGIF